MTNNRRIVLEVAFLLAGMNDRETRERGTVAERCALLGGMVEYAPEQAQLERSDLDLATLTPADLSDVVTEAELLAMRF